MITVKNLAFTYPKSPTPALKGVNFNVEKGQIFGFLGPSGAGKSTLQKILIGLLQDYQGEISVLDKPRSAWGSEFYEQAGVSFELPNHYLKLTALENLNYFRSLYDGDTEDPHTLLQMVGLGDDANLLVSRFSKGMQMRLNFVRSLLNKPRLLFLDEPTSGLDPVNAKIIKDIILQQQAQGVTILMTTHNMNIADELCDVVAFIVDGETKLIDSPKALKLRYGERAVRVEYRQNGHVQNCDFMLDGLHNNQPFLNLLRDNHIETIHTRETTLENIFIKVTGRELA
jgi:fluoroquinolone transport system ATP-binding protein